MLAVTVSCCGGAMCVGSDQIVLPKGGSGDDNQNNNNGTDPKTPNVIVIITDDQGYADTGPFGARGFTTPNMDKMAQNGMRLTDFYVASSVSSPSRAALMTGCYPQRVDLPFVLFPNHIRGLNPNETTLPEVFKTAGYATACVGKWHLGHYDGAFPTQHGFDRYFGIPYSNDMRPADQDGPPLMENTTVLEYKPDQSQLTTRYTEYAVDFIDENKDNPFFLYLAHSMPHVPLAVSDKFKGKSEQGLYGDVIMEIDWSIGQLYEALERNGVSDNTWVIYLADNGPWLVFGNHGGSADPLREGKATSFEGGQRIFCITTWAGVIPAGSVCSEITTSMDILPTAAALLDVRLPDRPIDGKNILPLLTAQPDAGSPHEAFYYYYLSNVEAIRVGDWKFMLPHNYVGTVTPGSNGVRGQQADIPIERSLFNLRRDVGETINVADDYPDIADKLEKMLRDFDADLKKNIRPAGYYAR